MPAGHSMKQPRLTEEAEADLADIWLRMAVDNPANATRFIESVLEKCELLAGQPGIGRARPLLGPGLRSFAVGNYLIFYRAIADGIEVVRIIHGARNIEPLFRS